MRAVYRGLTTGCESRRVQSRRWWRAGWNQYAVAALDLVGTFVFALAAATAGARPAGHFGVAVLSFASACSGGIARDLMIGGMPPAALSDWRYVAASLLAGLLAFRWHSLILRILIPILLFDAAGRAL